LTVITLVKEYSPASELLETLIRQGAHIQLVHGRDLRVRAPHGVLTEERREMLKSHKAEIVALLTTYPCSNCGRFAFHKPTVCYQCRQPLNAA
jgi:hypothetical protein